MQKTVAFLVFTLLFSTLFAASAGTFCGTAKASTAVNGLIEHDQTWNVANSPYTLTGPVSINPGVTVTVEPGVTVDLNDHYLQVNGTLRAVGSAGSQITFTSSPLTTNPQPDLIFTPLSEGWNDQTASGSILQNVALPYLTSIYASVKIDQCSINSLLVEDGSAVISDCSIFSILVRGGSPTITGNDIKGSYALQGMSGDWGFTIGGGSPMITSNSIHIRPWARNGAPTFSGNKLYEGLSADSAGSSLTVVGNELYSGTFPLILNVAGIHADISENKFIGNNRDATAITVSNILSSATITNNIITQCNVGISLTQCRVQVNKNVIFNCNTAINIDFGPPLKGASGTYALPPTADITQNTIAQNNIGIDCQPYNLNNIAYNNIQDSSQYSFKLRSASSIQVPNNWWGTTDTNAIEQSIFDRKNDFNMGTVTFTPILTSPSPDAPAIPSDLSAPLTTPAATSQPTATQNPNENPHAPTPQGATTAPSGSFSLDHLQLVILAVVIVAVTVVVAVLIFGRKQT
jgi:hypothetical protein